MHSIKNRCPDIRLIKLDQSISRNTKTVMEDIKNVLACLRLYPIYENVSGNNGELTFLREEGKMKIMIKLTYNMLNAETNFITIRACYDKVPKNKRSKILKLINLMNNMSAQSRIIMIPDTGEVEIISNIIFYKWFHTAELFLNMEYLLLVTGRLYLDALKILISTNETPESLIDRFKNGSDQKKEV